MVCIYCGHGTEVINSRKRSRLPSIWRRRACKACVAQFTTLEQADYATALAIKTKTGPEPLKRDQLFLSLYKSLGHRTDALNSATALTETILGRLLSNKRAKEGVIDSNTLAHTSYEALRHFDKAAAASYKAYHRSSLK